MDMPAALQGHMLADLSLTESEYMGFYSWYQWPAVGMAFIGGYLVDRLLGTTRGFVLFALAICIGQAVFAVGAVVGTYWVMCVGRVMLGSFTNPLGVTQANLAVKWFQGRELNMVFALILSVATGGDVLCLNIMESIYTRLDQTIGGTRCLGVTLSVGVAVALLSFLAAVALWGMDKRVDKNLKLENNSEGDVVQLSHLKDFPVTYWLNVLTTAIFNLSILPFVALGLLYFERKYEMESVLASNINSMVYLIAAVAMPVVGFLIDRLGKNLYWMIAGVVPVLAGHAIFGFTYITPYLSVVLLGCGYSVFTAVVWPLVSMTVDPDHLGTAYGIMTAVIALCQALSAMLAGYIVDHHGYLMLEVFFLVCANVALLFSVALYLADASRGGILNRLESDIKADRSFTKAIFISETSKTARVEPVTEVKHEQHDKEPDTHLCHE